MHQRKSHREKDLTQRYLGGDFNEDHLEQQQRAGQRSGRSRAGRMQRTALLRAAEGEDQADLDKLPIGQVTQVFSLYSEVQGVEATPRLCVVRKTLIQLADASVVCGDQVRYRDIGIADEQGRPEAVIEQVLPRQTVLTRADSFKALDAQPIVANAGQMLVVVALAEPRAKWGLVDRMLVAAQGGGLKPIVCLNKVDLAETHPAAYAEAQEALDHYRSLGIAALSTSVIAQQGLEELRQSLRDQTTVLAGHSGVGKSSLIRSVQPSLQIRVAAISGYTGKGRHTTTSSRRYPLDFGGHVVDTPGVKLFGLWNVSRENLSGYFPDVAAGTAPTWRVESYRRIEESLG